MSACDAAHLMAPFADAGANLAMADSADLASHLPIDSEDALDNWALGARAGVPKCNARAGERRVGVSMLKIDVFSSDKLNAPAAAVEKLMAGGKSAG